MIDRYNGRASPFDGCSGADVGRYICLVIIYPILRRVALGRTRRAGKAVSFLAVVLI